MPAKGSIALALIAVLAMAGCNSTTTTTSHDNSTTTTTSHELTEADDGSTVQIGDGESISVTLESNPSTGYYWRVTEIDNDVLEQDGEPEFEDGNEEGMVGAPGEATFHFNAVGTGSTTLTLVYAQGEDGEPEEEFSVTVEVE